MMLSQYSPPPLWMATTFLKGGTSSFLPINSPPRPAWGWRFNPYRMHAFNWISIKLSVIAFSKFNFFYLPSIHFGWPIKFQHEALPFCIIKCWTFVTNCWFDVLEMRKCPTNPWNISLTFLSTLTLAACVFYDHISEVGRPFNDGKFVVPINFIWPENNL